MQAQTQLFAQSQQAYGASASLDRKSDRAFAATLVAMLLAVLALPFAGAAQVSAAHADASEPAQRLVVEQAAPAAPATATLETVVITGRRGAHAARSQIQADATAQTQVEPQAAAAASRS